MTTKSTEAWVLHKSCSGDSSVRLSLLTRELGLVHGLYRGGRAPKKQSLIQVFNPLWLCLEERYDRYFVRSIESIGTPLVLQTQSLFSGLYINELLYYILKPAYPVPLVFDAYVETLSLLSAVQGKQEIESVLRRFEWSLLKACGYSFSWTEEAHSGLAISASLYYDFEPGSGFLRRDRGIPGQHILALAKDDLSDKTSLRWAKWIMRHAIDHLLGGRTIKARVLYVGSLGFPFNAAT